MESISITQTRTYGGYPQAYDALISAYETGDRNLIENAAEKFRRSAPSNLFEIITNRLDSNK